LTAGGLSSYINDVVVIKSSLMDGLHMTTGDQLQAFLTTEDVLGYLKVTPRTIYRLIRIGELPAVRIGRQWRFRRADLDEWLDRQRAV
jgi:excisionase family DNA binding protein